MHYYNIILLWNITSSAEIRITKRSLSARRRLSYFASSSARTMKTLQTHYNIVRTFNCSLIISALFVRCIKKEERKKKLSNGRRGSRRRFYTKRHWWLKHPYSMWRYYVKKNVILLYTKWYCFTKSKKIILLLHLSTARQVIRTGKIFFFFVLWLEFCVNKSQKF